MGRERLLRSLQSRLADERVLAAVAEVPRERFVAPALSRFAYLDRPLPIGGGQTISQPTLVARMCELLELSDDDVALDVGTGSGYHAAVLSRLCRHVYGIELDEELAEQAVRSLELAGIDNVTVLVGDGGMVDVVVSTVGGGGRVGEVETVDLRFSSSTDAVYRSWTGTPTRAARM